MTLSPDQSEKPQTPEEKGTRVALNMLSTLEDIQTDGQESFWNHPTIKNYQWIGKYWPNIDEEPAIDSFLRGITDNTRPPKKPRASPLETRYNNIISNSFHWGRRTRNLIRQYRTQLEQLENENLQGETAPGFSGLISGALFLKDIIDQKVDYSAVLGFQEGFIKYLKEKQQQRLSP